MAGGGRVQIHGANDLAQGAHVVNNRLLVDTGGGSGPTGDVNIASVGGVLVTSPLPVLASQGTSPWVVSGTVAVTQSTSPWVVSGTVDSVATGLVSAGNSTNTPLGGGATFTGTFENVKDYAAVTVTVLSTQNSATDGMKLQWSHNGINVDQENSVTILANQGRAFAVPVEGLFFRVVYTNGATPQVTFRLGIVYKPTAAGLNAVSIDQDINSSGAIVIGTRSLITGETTAGGGAFVNVKVTPSGALVADVTQGTSPWVVSGTLAVTQGTSPWVVSGTVTANIGNQPILVDQNLAPWSVTVASIVPGTAATNLGKAEDAIHASGDVGVMSLGVRQDTAAALAANGDYIPHTTDALGNLRVGGASTLGLGKVEDALHATGDVGVMALAVRNDAGAALAGNGDYIPLSTDSVGRLSVTMGLQIVAVSAVNVVPGTTASDLGKQHNLAFNANDVGVMSLAVRNDALGTVFTASDGNYSPIAVDSTGAVYVRNVEPGSVAVTAVVPGTAATNLGKAEDAVHNSGDVGTMALAVRQDVLAALAATGDYIPLTTDALGRLNTIKAGGKRTYRAATTVSVVAAAGAAMFFVITGSSTQTVIVQRIVASGPHLTAVAYNSIVCEKWSTAPTGGTATTLTKVPMDSNNAAATTGLTQVYTVAPTEGTPVGTVACRRILMQATTAVAAGLLPNEVVFDFRNMGEPHAGVLRGTAEGLSLAFGAAPATAVTLAVEVEWTEE